MKERDLEAKLFRWLVSNRGEVGRAVARGIQNCIGDHGLVTKPLTGSAVKRVLGELKLLIRQQRDRMNSIEDENSIKVGVVLGDMHDGFQRLLKRVPCLQDWQITVTQLPMNASLLVQQLYGDTVGGQYLNKMLFVVKREPDEIHAIYSWDATLFGVVTFVRNPTTPLKQLHEEIEQLMKAGAYHRTRGFQLRNVPVSVITNHLIEEAVEIQGEALHGTPEGVIMEAGDMLANFIYLLLNRGIDFDDVVAASRRKLPQVFTTNADEIVSTNVGFIRSNRPNK